jgi:hypothetical protein
LFCFVFFFQPYLLGRTPRGIRISASSHGAVPEPWPSASPHPDGHGARASSHPHLRVLAPTRPDELAHARPGELATQHLDVAAPRRRTACAPCRASAPWSLPAPSAPPPIVLARLRKGNDAMSARGGHQCEAKLVGAGIFGSSSLSLLVLA